jgi:AAA domain
MVKEVEALYSVATANINYSVKQVRDWAKKHAMTEAVEKSIPYLDSGEPDKILELIHKALLVGDPVQLADKSFFTDLAQLAMEIIQGVLRVRNIGILNSMSNAYKSWNILALAIATALGKSWLGFPACNQVRSLYVNLELEEEEFKVRIDLVAKAMGTTRADLYGKLDFLNLKGHPTDLKSVLRQIRMRRDPSDPWKFCVIESAYKLLTGDDNEKENIENNNAAIGAMFGKLEQLARELETAIFLVHHMKKGNAATTSTIDSGSGAGVFGRAPDVVFLMRPLLEKNTWRIESGPRYFLNFDPFGVRLGTGDLFPLLARDHTLDLDAEPGKPGRPKKYQTEDAVAVLQKGGVTNKKWQDLTIKELRCSEKTFRDLRDDALDRRLAWANGPVNARSTLFFPTEQASMAIAEPNRVDVIVSKLGPAKKDLEKK